MSEKLIIKYDHPLSPQQEEYIEERFSEMAYKARGLPKVEKFFISFYDELDALKATVYGFIYYGCLEIGTLFVEENLRGRGFGKDLMQKAEKL
jgi:GNAT superfamily N-acetyltransferase